MGIDKIKANIVAVGKPGKHDLGEANNLLTDSLKKSTDAFSSYWNGDSKTVYTMNAPYLPNKVIDPKIIVYDYPINFEDWREALRTNHIPQGFFKHEGPKLVCSLEYSCSNIRRDKLEHEVGLIESEVHDFFNLFKSCENRIVPHRSLNLLWDNEYMLFIPEAFKQYIKRNETGFAITGELNRE
jgi:hypothetical protein